jgi:lipoprotein-anchoring transpeptidase ErfK/SrfK
MARRGRYKLPVKSKGRGSPFLWFVVLGLIALAAWLWWEQHGRPGLKPAPKPKPVVLKPTQRGAPAPATPKEVAPVVVQHEAPTPPKPTPPIAAPTGFPRPPRDAFEAQVALARMAISSGSIDGVIGSQTRAALITFQRKESLPQTGALDADTRASLLITSPPLTTYVVTADNLARLQPLSQGWLAKSQQSALDYETILELVAEKGHASPNYIRRINPGLDWTNVMEGTEIQIPDVNYPSPAQKATFAVISLSRKTLETFDSETNLLSHFPCSIATRVEKRPVGELHVAVVAPNPNYTFDPAVFPESPEAQEIGRKLILQPGPNNPVGVAWIGLDMPGYGMHGTPAPEQVGRTESHGCFRLANWNAEYLVKLVWVGMPVYVEP